MHSDFVSENQDGWREVWGRVGGEVGPVPGWYRDQAVGRWCVIVDHGDDDLFVDVDQDIMIGIDISEYSFYSGLTVGSVFSLVLFKRRMWPITFGMGMYSLLVGNDLCSTSLLFYSGAGFGMGYNNCERDVNEPYMVNFTQQSCFSSLESYINWFFWTRYTSVSWRR